MEVLQKELSPNPLGAVSSGRLDILGAGLSLMCLVHCSVMPFLPLLLSAAPWLGDERIHLGLLVLIVPVAFFSLLHGVRRHGKTGVLWIGGLGMALLFSALLLGESFEKPLTTIGSLVLCAAHLVNRGAYAE